jgi:hypothetical protein
MNFSHQREPFDETTKAFYHRLFKNWGLVVETEREVFSRSRTIDLVVACTDADQVQLQKTVFAHFRQLNAIELKGFHDPLTVDNFNRIMMRAWGLGVKKSEPKFEELSDSTDNEDTTGEPSQLANEITLTMVCVTRPNKILNQLEKEYRFVATKDAGIYHSDDILGRWIIYLSELDLVPKNYPLLPLAQGKKLDQFISLCVREGLNDYLQLILDVGLATDPELVWRKILEVKQMKHLIREDTWPIIDQFFQEMPEAIGKLPTFQEALAESQRCSLQQGLQQGEKIGEQRTLIRQLRRKFTRVPKGIVQRIETTSDLDQLDSWLDQVISAKKLAEIDFNEK